MCIRDRNTSGLFREEEIGVSYPCPDPGYFNYFAGARAGTEASAGYREWKLPEGEYIVCSFEAENFEALVMDALYKAQQYFYGTWIPKHKLQTEPFCAERYADHSPETGSMEIWAKVIQPVSYTHLDVYKRQVMISFFPRFLGRWR